MTLSVDGSPVDTQSHQWHAYQVQRAASAGGSAVHSHLRIADAVDGVSVVLSNISFDWANPTLVQHNVSLRVAAEVRKFARMPWNFVCPGGADWIYSWSGLQTDVRKDGHGVLTVADTKSASVSAVAFLTSAGSDVAPASEAGAVTISGNPRWLAIAVTVASTWSAAVKAAAALSVTVAFDALWRAARRDWEARWRDAFDPRAKRYSGSWPRMELEHSGADGGSSDLERVYYMSCLTVLGCERTNLPLVAPRVYLTAFGTSHTSNGTDKLHGGAAAFFWDQSVYATLQSLLDPVWMRGFLLSALGGGKFDNNLFVDLLANEPGGGYWYAFNTVSVFWMLEGYLSVTNDRELLYDMPINGESVSELLERLATNWTDPRWSSTSPEHKWLADYGGTADNFLECIPTYVHTPAALQAQNVHMLRSVARLHRRFQRVARPLGAVSCAARRRKRGPLRRRGFSAGHCRGDRERAVRAGAFADVMLRRLFGYLPTLGFEVDHVWLLSECDPHTH
mmetsp:Transcript_53389/g.172456  ORF Transcript_53389/g.172456 Transcript_53389/m.172456 type:complete len:508 (-) Transcript_53389:73-1596(-)